MKTEEINYYLNNSLVLRMIEETHFNEFVKAVEHERELACGLITWSACVRLAIYKYFRVEEEGR